MSLANVVLLIDSGDGARRVSLGAYLDTQGAEAAERDANQWIKRLRHARIDGVALRDYLTFRGDSLWWFVELYLHKGRAIVAIHAALLALDTLITRERPVSMILLDADPVVRLLAPQVAKRWHIRYQGPRMSRWNQWRARVGIGARSAFYAASALAARFRTKRAEPRGLETDANAQARGRPRWTAPRVEPTGEGLAAFVHTAFWRHSTDEEGYIGPVLDEVMKRLPPGALRLVGVGPRTTFGARTWRHRLTEFRNPLADALPVTPIDAFTTWSNMQPSFALWRQRGHITRALLASEDLRKAAMIGGCDAWPIVRLELHGVATLQLPWSARAMDEAGAALERERPRAVVTYAEAGGWGRAIILEARRRGIPTIGLQHGFIYRHWLNYLHEPDEMQPSDVNPSDRGFPCPTLTLVYDHLTLNHLVDKGRFPRDRLAVIGSARLDNLVAEARGLTSTDLDRIRHETGVDPTQWLVVVAAKFTQIEPVFGALVQSVSEMPEVRLVVKCHPADTPEAYERLARGASNVAVAPASRHLASLVAASRLLVTVNSTAAIEAMVLGVPSLVLALPNNLSPFVEAGAMVGVGDETEIGPTLRRVLYDEADRERLARNRQVFLTQYGIGSDGCAASRAADRIVGLREAP